MEKEVVKNNNTMLKTIVFALVAGLTCLLFFGLGEVEKTQPELISFGVLLFSEILIYISLIIPDKTGHNSMDLFYASILYVIAALVLNYIIKPAVVKFNNTLSRYGIRFCIPPRISNPALLNAAIE